MPTIVANADGSYTITVPACPVATTVAPTITEVDVKESDGSVQVETPAETPAQESAETPAA